MIKTLISEPGLKYGSDRTMSFQDYSVLRSPFVASNSDRRPNCPVDKMLKLFIIMPLYIYPVDQAWDPLLNAARKHPHLQFVPVINPNSGPGEALLPDANYVAAISQLNELPNILPLGYVHCGYGNRTLDVIRGEIDLYRGWNPQLRLNGILFDETPADPDFVHAMAALTEYTKTTWQTSLNESALVIYNPGRIIDRAFFEYPDCVVVFEQTEELWTDYFLNQGLPLIDAEVRAKSAAIIHSCPDEGMQDNNLVAQVLSLGFSGILITDQMGGLYTQWPKDWDQLVEVAASFASS